MEEVGGALGATFLTMDCALPMLITCYSTKVELVSFSLNLTFLTRPSARTFSKDLCVSKLEIGSIPQETIYLKLGHLAHIIFYGYLQTNPNTQLRNLKESRARAKAQKKIALKHKSEKKNKTKQKKKTSIDFFSGINNSLPFISS